MDEEGPSGDSGSGSTAGHIVEDPFGLDQFLDPAAAWRATTGGIGSGSSSCSDGGDMNM